MAPQLIASFVRVCIHGRCEAPETLSIEGNATSLPADTTLVGLIARARKDAASTVEPPSMLAQRLAALVAEAMGPPDGTDDGLLFDPYGSIVSLIKDQPTKVVPLGKVCFGRIISLPASTVCPTLLSRCIPLGILWCQASCDIMFIA